MAEDFHSHTAATSSRRPLAIFIALSLVAHAGVLLLPAEPRDGSRSAQVQALEVMLLKPEAPPAVTQPVPREAVAAPARPPAARKPEVISTAKSVDPPHTPVEAPRASLPAAPQALPVPAAELRVPAGEARVEKPATEPVVAPSFNAAYLRNPAPRYPVIARRNGEQGTVMLKIRVSREGMPETISIDKSSGSAHLDNAALETVRSWRFVPARQGAQPVEAWVLVPIVFRLEPAV